MLTRGCNKLPQNKVPPEDMQTQNVVSHLYLDVSFCFPRIIISWWMLSLNRLAPLFSWEGLWQENRQNFSHVLQENVSIFMEVIHILLTKSIKISLSRQQSQPPWSCVPHFHVKFYI